MKCVICKGGKTESGVTTVVLERTKTTVVFKDVPAEVCGNCGEAYVGEATSQGLLLAAEAAVAAGVEFDVRRFVAA